MTFDTPRSRSFEEAAGEEEQAKEDAANRLTSFDFLRLFEYDPLENPPDLGKEGAAPAGIQLARRLWVHEEPSPSAAAEPGARRGLRLAVGDGSGGDLELLAQFVLRWVVRGKGGARRLFHVIHALRLSQEEWQCLFLLWLRGASVSEILAVDLPLLIDLTRRIGCRLDEVNGPSSICHKIPNRQVQEDSSLQSGHFPSDLSSALATEDQDPAGESPLYGGLSPLEPSQDSSLRPASPLGGRYPLLYRWCQVTRAVGKALFLSRLCAQSSKEDLQSVAVALLRGHKAWKAAAGAEESESEFEDGGSQGRLMGQWQQLTKEEPWVEAGLEQWVGLTNRVEGSWWLGRALNQVQKLNEKRGYDLSPCVVPPAKEVNAFPVAPWVARLELLISPSALVVSHLQSQLAKMRRSLSRRVSGVRLLEEGIQMENKGGVDLPEGAFGGPTELPKDGAEGGSGVSQELDSSIGGDEDVQEISRAVTAPSSKSSMMWARKKLLGRKGDASPGWQDREGDKLWGPPEATRPRRAYLGEEAQALHASRDSLVEAAWSSESRGELSCEGRYSFGKTRAYLGEEEGEEEAEAVDESEAAAAEVRQGGSLDNLRGLGAAAVGLAGGDQQEAEDGRVESPSAADAAAEREKRDMEEAVTVLKELLTRFKDVCQPDILAVHRSLELAQQWANCVPLEGRQKDGGILGAGGSAGGSSDSGASPTSSAHAAALVLLQGGAPKPPEGAISKDSAAVNDLLFFTHEHASLVPTVTLKGGVVLHIWNAIIGPRAAEAVRLLQRLGRCPTGSECARAKGLAGSTANEAAGAVGAYEQLLVLLFDCSLLTEFGDCEDPSMKENEDFLSSNDAMCRDCIGRYRREYPASELVHAYMLLLRTVGVALALNVDYVPLTAIFHPELLQNFPSLNLAPGVLFPPEDSKRAETRLQFLLAVVLAQMRRGPVAPPSVHLRGTSDRLRVYESRYMRMSAFSLANDLGVPHEDLKRRQVALKYLKS